MFNQTISIPFFQEDNINVLNYPLSAWIIFTSYINYLFLLILTKKLFVFSINVILYFILFLFIYISMIHPEIRPI